MKEIDLLKNEFKDVIFSIDGDRVNVVHPECKDVEKSFSITSKGKSVEFDIEGIRRFLSTKYLFGQSIARSDYFETLVEFANMFEFNESESTTINASGKDFKSLCFYEIGNVSDEFCEFLNMSMDRNNFSAECYHSIKIFNFNSFFRFDLTDRDFYSKIAESCMQVFFTLSSKHGLHLRLINLASDEEFEPEVEEYDTSKIICLSATLPVMTFIWPSGRWQLRRVDQTPFPHGTFG
jgi:hypothetical protein